MNKSILKTLKLNFLGFGALLGGIFPFFAEFFVTIHDQMFVFFLISCILAGLSIGFFNFLLVHKILLSRLERISEVAHAISNKDLTFTCSLESNDIIGDIVNSFNSMGTNLRLIIGEIQAHSQSMFGSADSMKSVALNSEKSSQTQFVEIQSIQEAVSQLSHYSNDVSDQASQILQITQQTNQNTQMGENQINKTISVITKLADDISSTANTISNLQMSSQAIGTVLDVIHGISEQTNLLALNAAIEAARAGEQGRGFAVVADEVRSLAAKTKESTHEINQMIEKLQADALSAVQAMNQSKEEASLGVQETNAAGQILTDIAHSISNLTSMNESINNASSRQLDVTSQINANIANLSQIATESQSGASRSVSQSEEIAQHTSELKHMVEGFKL